MSSSTANPQQEPVLEATPEGLLAARKAVISSSIGAALEWFDIIVFASFAVVISEIFYPEGDPVFSLILTFATFAISYLVRPIGGLVLGRFADRRGRKPALTLTLFLMMLGTLLMAIAPTYSQIGIWGALIILTSRLLQGFSAGGEFGTATTFLVETAPHRKMYYASWQIASQGASMALASAFGFALNTYLSDEALHSWGWRVPFLIGLLVGPVGLYIRSKLDETEEFTSRPPAKSPLRTLFANHWGRILAASASVGVATISVYMILFMPTFAMSNLGISPTAAYLGGILAGLICLIGSPLVGRFADRVGPARIMTYAAVAALVLALPLFQLIVTQRSVPAFIFVIAVLGVIMAFYFAPLPGMLSVLFPAEIRGTGLSTAYNIGVTLLGGIAPLVLTWLLDITGSLNSPSVYYMGVAVLSLIGLFFVRRHYGQR